MPLHLLGKKSWNVYNAENIAKVKKDQADAAAREEAREQRMQEADADRRIRILRGEQVESPPAEEKDEPSDREKSQYRRDGSGRERKRRRIAGEDETDREIRFAQEDRALVPARAEMQMTSKKSSDAPLTDTQGHINLFPAEMPKDRASSSRNAEAEAEKAKKKKEFEDQYTMRFSNAAGFKQAIGQTPWYQSMGTEGDGKEVVEAPSKDLWGNEDPRRREREKMRAAADDPLAFMRQGAAGAREAEKQKVKWREEKARELRALEEEERHKHRRRDKRRHKEDDLEGFNLDETAKSDDRRHRHHRHTERASRHSHRRHEHSSDKDYEPYRERHKSTASHAMKDRGWEAVPGGRYSNQYVQARS